MSEVPELVRLRLTWAEVMVALAALGIESEGLISLEMKGMELHTVHVYTEPGKRFVPIPTVQRSYEILPQRPA